VQPSEDLQDGAHAKNDSIRRIAEHPDSKPTAENKATSHGITTAVVTKCPS
jgi:hypothetical protein